MQQFITPTAADKIPVGAGVAVGIGVGVGETLGPETVRWGLDASTWAPLTSRKPYCPAFGKTNGSAAERIPSPAGVFVPLR